MNKITCAVLGFTVTTAAILLYRGKVLSPEAVLEKETRAARFAAEAKAFPFGSMMRAASMNYS